MKVNLVKWMNVVDIAKKDKDMLMAFIKFYEKLQVAKWNNPNDIIKTFNSADIIKCSPSNRVIFNVGGNKYRLISGYYFGKSFVNLYVKFVGSHAQYDRVEPCEVNMFKK